MTDHTLTEKLALKILANEGIEAIWRLHVAAAEAYRDGCPGVAASVTEISVRPSWYAARSSRSRRRISPGRSSSSALKSRWKCGRL